jgi:hypothetical protein
MNKHQSLVIYQKINHKKSLDVTNNWRKKKRGDYHVKIYIIFMVVFMLVICYLFYFFIIQRKCIIKRARETIFENR